MPRALDDLRLERAGDVLGDPLRGARREDRVGVREEDERGLLPAAELLAHGQVRRRVRMLGRDRDEVGEREDARLRLGHGPRRAVGLLDLVAHRLHGRDAHELAGDQVGADAAEEVAEAQPLVRRRPAAADAGVHDHEPRDAVGLLDGEAEADRPAPVLDDDREVAQVELLDEPRDRAGVEVVGVVLAAERLVGAAEAEVVGRDRAGRRDELGDDLAVEVRPGRLAVQQQDGRPGALVEVVHAQAVLLDVVRREAVAGQVVEAARRACGRRPPDDSTPVGVETGATGDSEHDVRDAATPRPARPIRPTVPRTRRSSTATGPSVPKGQVVVEQTEAEPPPPRKTPLIWPWLLALLVLVLGGLGAYFYFSQDDDEPAATATTPRPRRRRGRDGDDLRGGRARAVPDVVGDDLVEATATLRDAGFEATSSPCRRTGRAGQSSRRALPREAKRRRARRSG